MTLSLDKPACFVHSLNEKYKNNTLTNNTLETYQYTTKDINPNPSDYIRIQNSLLLYEKLGEELLQDEEDNK